MKKTHSILCLASLAFVLASCSNSQTEQSRVGGVDQTYTIDENFEDLDFGASELSYWLSYNKGKAELDNSKVKISTTTEYYGGIRSLYKTKIDFTKQVYLNFKAFESANANVSMMIKMVFHDYSSSDSAYILSNDVIGLNGDFSINIENALLRYGASVSNMELFDSRGELIFKDDKKVYVSFYISAFNNTNSGLSNDSAWIKFESFDVSYKDEKAGGELGCFTVSHDGINADNNDSSRVMTKTKNDPSFQIKPSLNSESLDSSEVIYASSNPNKVKVSSTGSVSFDGVTKDSARVVAYPRIDVTLGGFYEFSGAKLSKNSGFYVNVLGLWQGDDIYDNVVNLFASDDSVELNEDLLDLFEGNVLEKQKISVKNAIDSLNLVASSGTLHVLNNYLGSDEEKKQADDNDKSYSVNLAFDNDAYTSSTSGKVTIVNCGENALTVVSKDCAYAADDTFSIKIRYLNDDYTRYSENDRYLVLWDNGTSKKYAYFDTNVIDSQEVMRLSPADIAKSVGTDRSWDALSTEITQVDGVDVFRMNLNLRDLTSFYAAPFLKLYADMSSTSETEYIKIDFSRNVKMVIDFGECDNISYNLRFYRIAGRYVDEYWRDEGAYYTDLTVGDEFMLVDLYHYASKGTIPGMISLTKTKSLPVEFGFDISLRERGTIGNKGHLDIKNIYFLYE